jgi:predicted glutamine amidotransferase
MCQIVVIRNNKKLDKKFLETQFNFNSDGIGIAYLDVNDNSWYFKKFKLFDEFFNYYNSINYSKCVIHFRTGTSGSNGIENCHPFLISESRDVNVLEGKLENDEILVFQNGVTNEIFNVYKFLFGEDDKINEYSDTKLIAYTLGKLKIFNVDDVANRIRSFDKESRFVVISNKKMFVLGEFIQKENNVLLSSHSYFDYGDTTKRLGISSELETEISKLIGVPFQRIFFSIDTLTGLFHLEIENRELVFGTKGLKRYLKGIGMEKNKIESFIERIEKEMNNGWNNKRQWYGYV